MNHVDRLKKIEEMRDIENLPLDKLIPHYLIHCAAYYHLCFNIISDNEFDALSRRIVKEWDKLTHPHKELIDRSALLSGGNYIQLPTIVLTTANDFKRTLHGAKKNLPYIDAVLSSATTISRNRRKKPKVEAKPLDMSFFKRKKK